MCSVAQAHAPVHKLTDSALWRILQVWPGKIPIIYRNYIISYGCHAMPLGQNAGMAFHWISSHSSQKVPVVLLFSIALAALTTKKKEREKNPKPHKQKNHHQQNSVVHMINNVHNNPAMLHWLCQIKLPQRRGLSQLFVSVAQLPTAHFSSLHILLLSIHDKPNTLPTLFPSSPTNASPDRLAVMATVSAGFVVPAHWFSDSCVFWGLGELVLTCHHQRWDKH